MSHTSPPLPWKKGQQEHYATVVVEVEVCRVNDTGHVFSTHHVQGQEYQEILMTWPSGGQEQVAFALLTEACRREAVLDFLVQMSNDPDWLKNLQDLPEEEREEKFKAMGESLTKMVQNITDGIAESCVREAYDAMVR